LFDVQPARGGDAVSDRDAEWRAFALEQHKQGNCEHSCLSFWECAATVCDCGLEYLSPKALADFIAKAERGEAVDEC
jgi:hypothetical protein